MVLKRLPNFSLLKILKERGIKQYEFSEMTGFSETKISRFINRVDSPSNEFKEAASQALRVDSSAIFDRLLDSVME